MGLRTDTIRRMIPGAGQNVAYTATMGKLANTMPEGTRCVMVHVTSAAFVMVGGSVAVASATGSPGNGILIPAGGALVLDAQVGDTVSAVRLSGNGTLYACPMF